MALTFRSVAYCVQQSPPGLELCSSWKKHAPEERLQYNSLSKPRYPVGKWGSVHYASGNLFDGGRACLSGES